MEQKLEIGDTVSFDIEGSSKSPYGFGTVTRATPTLTLIQPQQPLTSNMKMKNIKKVGT